MPKDNTERYDDCKTAAMELMNQLESRGITMVGCGAAWNDDKSDSTVSMMIHESEEKNHHALPQSIRGFLIKYEYVGYTVRLC